MGKLLGILTYIYFFDESVQFGFASPTGPVIDCLASFEEAEEALCGGCNVVLGRVGSGGLGHPYASVVDSQG